MCLVFVSCHARCSSDKHVFLAWIVHKDWCWYGGTNEEPTLTDLTQCHLVPISIVVVTGFGMLHHLWVSIVTVISTVHLSTIKCVVSLHHKWYDPWLIERGNWHVFFQSGRYIERIHWRQSIERMPAGVNYCSSAAWWFCFLFPVRRCSEDCSSGSGKMLYRFLFERNTVQCSHRAWKLSWGQKKDTDMVASDVCLVHASYLHQHGH